MIGRYFVRKYTLPTSHACYLARSEVEWLEEMYADRYAEQQQVAYDLAQLPSSGLDAKAQEAERRRLMLESARLAKALGEAPPEGTSDTLLDELDASLARGEKVDLSALLPKGYVTRKK